MNRRDFLQLAWPFVVTAIVVRGKRRKLAADEMSAASLRPGNLPMCLPACLPAATQQRVVYMPLVMNERSLSR